MGDSFNEAHKQREKEMNSLMSLQVVVNSFIWEEIRWISDSTVIFYLSVFFIVLSLFLKIRQ